MNFKMTCTLHAWVQLFAFMLISIVLCAKGDFEDGLDLKSSPCPNYFQYELQNGKLIGNITLVYPKQSTNILEVDFDVVVNLNDSIGEGKLSLLKTNANQDIEDEKPVTHILNFPHSIRQPKVERIILNGVPICHGQPIGRFPTYKQRQLHASIQVNCTLKECLDDFGIEPSTDGATEDPDDVTHLIFGGVEIQLGQFPWLLPMMVKHGNLWAYSCVGNLITRKHILTAAHCMFENRNSTFKEDRVIFPTGVLKLTDFDIETFAGNGEIKRIFVHPQWSSSRGIGDIAIAVYKEKVTFSKYLKPVRLWPYRFGTDLRNIVNKKGSVAGWGLDESIEISLTAKAVDIPVVTNEQCRNSAPIYSKTTSELTFCAGDKNNEGPCNGDSGSGFIVKRRRVPYLRGIVSFSLRNKESGICDLYNYIVFTDVVKFSNWIYQVANTL